MKLFEVCLAIRQEFDATERAITAVEGLKTSVKNSEQFLSITYQKAVSVLDKIQARNTDAMQKLYRESFQKGDGTHGFDLLKRTADAVSEATAIVNFIAGLHDPEASFATFEVA